MPHIFVVNSKGGSGKTTITTQLASYYAKRGDSVVLADHDPQKSSCDWIAARPENCAKIQLIPAKLNELVAAPTENTIVIHDMPAGWIPTIDSPVFEHNACHQMLIPMLPSPTDIKAGLRFIMALTRSGVLEKTAKAALVANRTRSNIRYNNILMDFLHRVDLPLIGSVRDSQNYIRAIASGISIFDLPAGRMKADVEQWQPIIEWLENR